MSSDSKRKPWLATLASLLMPGLGQIYNGEFIKGLGIFISLAILIPLSAWLAIIGSKHIILFVATLFELIMILIYVYSIVNAGRTARRLASGYTLKPVNRGYIYAIFLVAGAAIFLSLGIYRTQHLLDIYKVASQGMLPNLMPGDRILVKKRINCQGCRNHLQNGMIVLFHDPKKPTQLSFRRIIGLPGDQVQIKGHDIFVNTVPTRSIEMSEYGHAELNNLLNTNNSWREKNVKAVYYVFWPKDGKPENFSTTVPEGKVFVMNDNRADSNDSRSYGSIPIDKLIGVAEQVAYSSSKTNGIRWWRIGKVISAIY